jgi:hypothetical protein
MIMLVNNGEIIKTIWQYYNSLVFDDWLLFTDCGVVGNKPKLNKKYPCVYIYCFAPDNHMHTVKSFPVVKRSSSN